MIKRYATLIFLFFSLTAVSQNLIKDFRGIADNKPKNIDRNDKTALRLVTAFYEEGLQADNSELHENTIGQLKAFMAADDSKNKYLLDLFFMYQQHITETAAIGKNADAEFQVYAMTLLEKEFKDVYGKVPAIIYIYKSEALNNDNMTEAAKQVVMEGLANFPDSVPLKVYSYLDTKDEKLRKDLVSNHPNHWLVLQNQIK